MKETVVIFIVLLFCSATQAQPSNIHVAGVLGLSGNVGLENPTAGVSAGFDLRHRRFTFSADGEIQHVTKRVGGSGYQVSVRESGRFYTSDRFFIQVVSRQWHYSVRDFSKSGVEIGGGIGMNIRGHVYSLSYDHELAETQHLNGIRDPFGRSSETKTIEAKAEYFLRHHVYLSPRIDVARFRSSGKYITGFSSTLQAGFWWR